LREGFILGVDIGVKILYASSVQIFYEESVP